jgi:hypothetical protein
VRGNRCATADVQRSLKAQRAARARWIVIAVPLADENVTALVIPGLWEHLWSNKIGEFEHDPRLGRSMSGFSEEEYEATRERWVAAACQQLKERSVGTPRECYEAREHPLVADRWLQVDAADKATVAEGAVGYTPIGGTSPMSGSRRFWRRSTFNTGTPSDPTCC